jgi:hypothetical protein
MTGAPLGMSIEAIRWALREAPGVPAQCLGVLIGLAEHADKHGRSAYPSAITLSRYARKSERQVRADLMLLAEAKVIRPLHPTARCVALMTAGRQPVAQGCSPLPGCSPLHRSSPLHPKVPLTCKNAVGCSPLQARRPICWGAVERRQGCSPLQTNRQ